MGPPPRRRLAGLLCAAALCVAGPAGAVVIPIPSGSFETGTTAGWNTVGQVSVTTAAYGVAPTDATYQVLLTTGAGAVNVPTTLSAMGLPNNTLRRIFRRHLRNPGLSTSTVGATEGSAIQISFAAQAGDQLLFDWDFLTDELQGPGANPSLYTDFVWGHLQPPAGQNATAVIAHVNQPPGDFFASATPFADETGYMTFSAPLSQTGTYTLTLGVHDVEDTFVDSGVVFDWFRISRAPEPDTFALLGLGLLGLALYGRREARPRRDSSAMSPKSSTTFVRAPSPRNSR